MTASIPRCAVGDRPAGGARLSVGVAASRRAVRLDVRALSRISSRHDGAWASPAVIIGESREFAHRRSSAGESARTIRQHTSTIGLDFVRARSHTAELPQHFGDAVSGYDPSKEGP